MRTRRISPRAWNAWTLALAAGIAVAHPLHAQQAQQADDDRAREDRARDDTEETSVGWFPGSLVVRPLVSGSSGVDIAGAPMFVRRDAPAGSENVSPEARVGFGYRLPVYRFRDGHTGGPALDLALEAGVKARFALGDGANGLQNSDFRVAVPLGARSGRWEGILSLVHVSSHLGDNFIEQNPDFESGAVSRNGFEAMALYGIVPDLRVFVGGDYNFATAVVETFAGRFGLDFDPRLGRPGTIRPIGTFEAMITDLTQRWSFDALAGIGVRTGPGELRFAVTAHTGPSSLGHFRRVDERFVGVMISVIPGVVARSR